MKRRWRDDAHLLFGLHFSAPAPRQAVRNARAAWLSPCRSWPFRAKYKLASRTARCETRKGFTRQLKSELRHNRLRVSDVFLQVGPEPSIAAANDPDPRVRMRNRKIFMLALDLCSALDCAHLTGLPGVRHPDIAEADDLARAREVAAWRQHAASDAGVKYAIEPHIGSICSDVASARAFIESVPGLTLTLDYGHFVAAGTPCTEIHPLLPFAYAPPCARRSAWPAAGNSCRQHHRL